MNRVGHAFIKQRMRAEDAVFAGEVSAHYYFRDFSQADTGVVPFLVMLELVSRSGATLSELLRPVSRALLPHRRDQHAGRRRPAEAPGAQGALHRRGRPRLAPGRDLDRLRRLALQRPPVQHRAAAALNLEALSGGAHGREARRGARAHPRVTDAPGARPRHRTGGRRSSTRRSRASGSPTRTRRASSTTGATCRTSTTPGPSTTATSAGSRRGGCEFVMRASSGRVPRAGTLRRPDRGVRPRVADRPHERDVRVRRLPPPDDTLMVTASRRSCSSTSSRAGPRRSRTSFERRRAVREGRPRGVSAARSTRSTARSTRPRTPTTSCATVSRPRRRARDRLGRIAFVEDGTIGLGPAAGDARRARRTRVPIVFQGAVVGELWVDGDVDASELERVADRIAPHVLIGWDTGGEAWEP